MEVKRKMFKYGNAFEKYPVEPGDVWHIRKEYYDRTGMGMFFCGDMMEVIHGDKFKDMIPEIDAIYSDPPWSQSNMDMFYNGGLKDLRPYPLMAESFTQLNEQLKPKLIFLEMSSALVFLGYRGFRERMGNPYMALNVTYGIPAKPSRLVVWRYKGMRIKSPEKTLHGTEVINWVISQMILNRLESMIDPCCGKGTYPFCAMEEGIIAHGIELLPRKYAHILQTAASKGYYCRKYGKN